MESKITNSLGINKPEKNTKIVVAMSGGVDSSTVAGLMKEEGYKVIGVTLKLYDDANISANKKRQCCAGQDIMDAKRIANQLNIEHKILYFQKKFKKDVIDNFVKSYISNLEDNDLIDLNDILSIEDDVIRRWYFEKKSNNPLLNTKVSAKLKNFKL